MNKTTNKELLEEKITKLIQTVEDAGSWKKPFKSVMTNGLPTNHYSKKLYKEPTAQPPNLNNFNF